ncbi:MAG: GTP-binding protein [Microthrixaceae bacterium]
MILGTAGHVDHGKSTLVRLLSGTDPDRWEEEQRRGLTIGLGYGFIDLPGVGSAAIIDVPGHNRFLPAMLQGAHGVDITLPAVAAHVGGCPETAEQCGDP